jgi:hypothetical protein
MHNAPTTPRSNALAGGLVGLAVAVAVAGCARDWAEVDLPADVPVLRGAPRAEPAPPPAEIDLGCGDGIARAPRFDLDVQALPWDGFGAHAVDAEGALVQAAADDAGQIVVARVQTDGTVDGPHAFEYDGVLQQGIPLYVAPQPLDPVTSGDRSITVVGCGDGGVVAFELQPGEPWSLRSTTESSLDACRTVLGFSWLDDELVVLWVGARNEERLRIYGLRTGTSRSIEGYAPLDRDFVQPLTDGAVYSARRAGPARWVGERLELRSDARAQVFQSLNTLGARISGFHDTRRSQTWLVWETFGEASFDVDVEIGRYGVDRRPIQVQTVMRGAETPNDLSRVAVMRSELVRVWIFAARAADVEAQGLLLGVSPLDRPRDVETLWTFPSVDLPELVTDGRSGLWLSYFRSGVRRVAFFPPGGVGCDPE